jgi:hypothetical protein
VKHLLLYTLVLIFILVACTQRQAPQLELEPQALTYDTVKWLVYSDAVVIRRLKDLGNCVANNLNVTPQPPRSGGVSGTQQDGGLTYELVLPNQTGITTAASVGESWLNVRGLLGRPQRNVTLYIVDDFHGVYGPKPKLFTQTTLNGATLATLQNTNNLSHGALVLQHMKDVIRGTGLYPFSITTPLGDMTTYRTQQDPLSPLNRTLTIKTLDPGFEDTGLIAGSVRSAVVAQKLTADLPSFSGEAPFIINMSFALFPCLAYADYRAWDDLTPGIDETFVEYIKALANHQTPVVTVNTLASLIVGKTNDPNDPLLKFLQTDPRGVGGNIFVAAAGNYSFNVSMFPAGLNGVINATGSIVKNTSIRSSRLFNRGEIMDVGASFVLEASRFTRNPLAKDLYYLGTSFSTPTLSVLSALDAAGKKRCVNIGGIKSDLAINGLGLVDSPLVTAVSKLCVP